MAKNSQEGHLYVCNVCKEEYIGSRRKWTCPVCGTADSFDEVTNEYEEDTNYEDDYFD